MDFEGICDVELCNRDVWRSKPSVAMLSCPPWRDIIAELFVFRCLEVNRDDDR